jgi:hypothetical protein
MDGFRRIVARGWTVCSQIITLSHGRMAIPLARKSGPVDAWNVGVGPVDSAVVPPLAGAVENGAVENGAVENGAVENGAVHHEAVHDGALSAARDV